MKVDLLKKLKLALGNFIKVSYVALISFSLASNSQASSNIFNDSQNAFGVTPLMSAVVDQDITGVTFFARSESNYINQKNIGGATALHLAARDGNINILKILIENGAELNTKDNEGWTPLMRATLASNKEAVGYLLDNNADASLLNDSSESVIFHATSVSCNVCLLDMFKKYDFEKNMGLKTLKSQINTSYEAARNKEDKNSQEILSGYLDIVTKSKSVLSNDLGQGRKYNFDRKILSKTTDLVPEVINSYKLKTPSDDVPVIPKAVKYRPNNRSKKFVIIKGEDKKVDVQVSDKIEKVIILNEENEVINEIKVEDISDEIEIKQKKLLFKFNKTEDKSSNIVEIEESEPKYNSKKIYKIKRISEDKAPDNSDKENKNILEKQFVNDEVFNDVEGDDIGTKVKKIHNKTKGTRYNFKQSLEGKVQQYKNEDETIENETESSSEEYNNKKEIRNEKKRFLLKKEGNYFSSDVIEEDYDNDDYLDEDNLGDIEADYSNNENKRYYFIPSR